MVVTVFSFCDKARLKGKLQETTILDLSKVMNIPQGIYTTDWTKLPANITVTDPQVQHRNPACTTSGMEALQASTTISSRRRFTAQLD